jgi:hypothetical protein
VIGAALPSRRTGSVDPRIPPLEDRAQPDVDRAGRGDGRFVLGLIDVDGMKRVRALRRRRAPARCRWVDLDEPDERRDPEEQHHQQDQECNGDESVAEGGGLGHEGEGNDRGRQRRQERGGATGRLVQLNARVESRLQCSAVRIWSRRSGGRSALAGPEVSAFAAPDPTRTSACSRDIPKAPFGSARGSATSGSAIGSSSQMRQAEFVASCASARPQPV